nr:beta-L-arabinofuranosidase domain-containing protein [Pseudorhodoferax sp.]
MRLGGLLGEAVEASRLGRLQHFVSGPDSAAIRLFDAAIAAGNVEGDWYGEHAGKWLVAAARAAARSGDAGLAGCVRRVADFLCDQQRADGYLGTYAESRRFDVRQPPKPPSWDGAPSVRTWDVWTHSYLMLGLVEAHRHQGEARWLQAACRIGELCLKALGPGGLDITELGNHFGLSATVLMDPACELFFATGERRYLELAERVLEQADAHPPLALLPKAPAGADPAEIATGKAYQLGWNLVGRDAAEPRAAADHRRRGACRGDRTLGLQRPARRAGAEWRRLVLLQFSERPACAHDLLALLQEQRGDGRSKHWHRWCSKPPTRRSRCTCTARPKHAWCWAAPARSASCSRPPTRSTAPCGCAWRWPHPRPSRCGCAARRGPKEHGPHLATAPGPRCRAGTWRSSGCGPTAMS